jgi:hypothetical protein
MTHSQKLTVLILGLVVIAIFGGLFYLLGRDLFTYQIAPFVSNIRAARVTPGPPTVVLVWPTADRTPAPPVHATFTADQAILFAQNFKYAPDQEKSVAGLIATIEAASEQLGNEIKVEGWWAEDQRESVWVVAYNYWENTTPKTYKFLVDSDLQNVQGYNEAGLTLLTFLRQQAEGRKVEPTATTVAIPLGWAMRDYFTNWEYSAPERPQSVKSITYAGKQASSEGGFLAIPFRLRNIGGVTQTVGPEFYSRFTLRDRNGKAAGLPSETRLLRPTYLFCRSRGMTEFTEGNLGIEKNSTFDTALVFGLLQGSEPPYTLEITVYDGSVPHRYAIKLQAES